MLIRVKYLLILTISIQQRNKTKQARLSSLLLLSIGAAFITFASKTSIVSINYAKANSSYLSGLEQSFWPCTNGHHQEKERDSQERGKEPVFSFRGQWGLALIARRNVCDSSHTFARRKAGDSSTAFAPVVGDVWSGCLRKSSPFTSFSLSFGKLTTEFEVLC